MHHQFLILKYIFEHDNMEVNFDSIDSFFENGISFPRLIEKLYSTELPDIQEDDAPWRKNDKAYSLLYEYNQDSLGAWPIIFTHRERKKLLSIIFNKCRFTMKPEDILLKSNLILKPINIQFKSTKDIIDGYFILSLLHALTDGKVKIYKNINKKKFDQIMKESFEIAHAPLIIDKKAMSKSNTDYFYIQVQILFEFFADKIDQMINDEFYPFDIFEDEALFKTIREISKNFFNLTNFDQTFENNFIPKFVMNFLNISSIENVDLNEKNNEIKNIKATIEYLSFKADYKVAVFDFEDQLNRDFSIKLFFRIFCNLFYLKSSRRKMIERCSTLLFNKKNWIPENLFDEFSKYDTFLYLVHFCIHGHLNLKLKKKDLSDDFASELFAKAGIPMLINQKILSVFSYEDDLPDSLFYQLQFIYDKIDSSTGPHRLVEKLMIAKKKIKDAKVPPVKIIKSKVKPVKILEITNRENKNKTENENEGDKFEKTKVTNKLLLKGRKEREEESEDDEEFMLQHRNMSDDFWSAYYKRYYFFNGILYNEMEEDISDKDYDEALNSVVNKANGIDEEDELKPKKKKNKKKKGKEQKNNPVQLPRDDEKEIVPPDFDTKLYKIIYFDEDNDKWIFDQDAFDRFAEDSNIKSEGIRCPVISYFPAEESDILQLNCAFITGMYPILGFEEEEDEQPNEPIFVYPFCDKTLANINEGADLPHDSAQESIKPIFLIVHVPKRKEKMYRIDVILFRLYIFLSLISDLKVIEIYGKNTLFHQESVANVIIATSYSISLKRSESIHFERDGSPLVEDFKENEHKNDSDCVYNGRHLIIKDHKMVYLLDKDGIEYNENYYKVKNLEPVEYLFRRPQHAMFCLIDILNLKTYKQYFNIITKISLESTSTYSEFLNNLQCIEATDICNRFFKFVYNELYEKPKVEIPFSFDHLEQLYKYGYKEDEASRVKRLRDAIDTHIPQFCKFIKDLFRIKMESRSMNMNVDSEKLSKMLENVRNEFKENVQEQMKRKQAWTKEEIKGIADGLVYVMKKKYFEFTKEFEETENHFDMYQYHYNDLKAAIYRAKRDIKSLFKGYFKDMELKNSLIQKNFQNDIDEGANYTLREKENVREITVEVEINSDLKSVIKQDF